MEEYWNPNDPSVTDQDVPAEQDSLGFEPEEQEPPKPKKNKKSFKRKVRRAIRRFFKLPLMTRCIAIAAVVLIIAAIVVLLIVLPKNCSNEAKGSEVVNTLAPTDEPVETPEQATIEPTAEPEPTATPFIIPALSGNLKLNDNDPNVVPYVRTRLVELGYMEMPATNDGLYDQATQNAVKRFQYRNFPLDLKDWDGWIGTKTYELLTSSNAKAFFMKSGDTDEKLYDGNLVTKLQEKLIQLGYLKTAATGKYDTATVDAIRSFQKANSVDVDGVAGQATLKLIDALVNAPASSEPTTVIENVTPAPEGTANP
ncbi:MAG: peptidoglycan-binding protein [Clostridia bacterium]|nr:peptidoglycan-binding protein [Clostridia bacterium]